jgi:large subunit ribosomal protein L24
MFKVKIKKGDSVKIRKGKDRGKTGKVVRVDREKNKVVVEGLNLFKKHMKPKKAGEKGQMAQVSHPIAVANVEKTK